MHSKNGLMTMLDKVVELLRQADVPHRVDRAVDPQLEDDEVFISRRVHVQVGENYVVLLERVGDDYAFHRTTLADLVGDVHRLTS